MAVGITVFPDIPIKNNPNLTTNNELSTNTIEFYEYYDQKWEERRIFKRNEQLLQVALVIAFILLIGSHFL